jgi:hypothetical protein
VTDAVKAAIIDAGIAAEIGGRPKDTGSKPFVSIWPDGPVRTAAKLNDPLGTETTVLICHCAGLTPEAARIAEQALFQAVIGLYRQTIDGRVVDRMPVQDWAHSGAISPSGGLSRDDHVSPALFDLPAEWRIRTSPA